MTRVILCGLMALTVLGACGRKGDLVRAEGTEPPTVSTSVIRSADTEPTKPRSTLF